MKRIFEVVVERDEDEWFVATVPALRGCHTQAETLDALLQRAREAVELCLEVPGSTRPEFVGISRVEVPA